MDPELDVEGGGEESSADEGREAAEKEASNLGWSPKERWRGNPKDWVDAPEFLEKGRTILAVARADNQRLLQSLEQARKQIAELGATVSQQSTTMKDLLKHQASEIKRQVESKIAGLRAEKLAATEDGDHKRAAALEAEIDRTKDELAEANAAPPPPAPKKTTFQGREIPEDVEPWARQFGEENEDWLGVNPKMTKLFMRACEDLREENPNLGGRQLLDKAKAQMEETLNPRSKSAAKSESGNGGWDNGGGGSSSSKDAYEKLPADAKAICKQQAEKFVGKLPGIKNEADWKAYYAKTFFESQTTR